MRPLTSRIIIDKTRILLASKKSYELDELKNLLQRTEFVLEEGIQKNSEIDQKKPMETINHTDKRRPGFIGHRRTDEPEKS